MLSKKKGGAGGAALLGHCRSYSLSGKKGRAGGAAVVVAAASRSFSGSSHCCRCWRWRWRCRHHHHHHCCCSRWGCAYTRPPLSLLPSLRPRGPSHCCRGPRCWCWCCRHCRCCGCCCHRYGCCCCRWGCAYARPPCMCVPALVLVVLVVGAPVALVVVLSPGLCLYQIHG